MTEGDSPVSILDLLNGVVGLRGSPSLDLDLSEPTPSMLDDLFDQACSLWQSSAFELLDGLEVTDFTDTISGEAFRHLFGQ